MARQDLFSKLPNVEYDISLNNKPIMVKNIFVSNKIVDKYANDPLSHYEYEITENDTIHSISELYYGDPRYYWVILLFNDIRDYLEELPKSPSTFQRYIDKVYGDMFTATSTPKYYYTKNEKISVETYNFIKNWFDSNFDNPKTEAGSATPNFNKKITYDKFEQFKKYSMFDFENELNEKNRTIKLLRSDILSDFIEEFIKITNRG